MVLHNFLTTNTFRSNPRWIGLCNVEAFDSHSNTVDWKWRRNSCLPWYWRFHQSEEPLKMIKLLNGMCKHTHLLQYSETEDLKSLCPYCFWIRSFQGDSPYGSVCSSSDGSFALVYFL